ncbi:MAG TPA: PxKF domain-containing protein [Pyrinomonadaceae bacterium]|nr:PxKF domain-containing protein [Pyrinomonadaceae bacterium]
MSPLHSIASRRFSLNTLRKSHSLLRLLAVLALVSIAAIALGATSSSATVFGPMFTRAAAIFGKPSARETKAAAVSPALRSAESAQPLSPTSAMATERRGHTATRLSDGRVLIAGGENSSGILNQAEIYDASSATFTGTGNMTESRVDHTATLLSDGRVLLAGGRNATGPVATTEIFDPNTGTFTSGPTMSVARAGHSATLFGDDRILFAGGDGNGSAEILNVSAGSSSAAGSMTIGRSMHSAALLQDGSVLIVGGRDAGGNEIYSGEVFSNGAFAELNGALMVARIRAHLRVLFDGKVQVIGGSNDGSMEIYDPTLGKFGAYAHVAPEGDTCAGLPDQVKASQTRAALFHNGQSDATFDRSSQTMSDLSDQAIVVGGANTAGTVLNSTPVFGSSGAALSTDKLDYTPGETAHITGRGFQPGETVRLKIHEDPHTPQERGFDAVTDSDGNFSGDYLVQQYDINMKFLVGARGLISGRTAQTTFTDSQPQGVTLTPTSRTVSPGGSAAYTVAVNMVGSGNCTMTLTAPFASPTPLGVGVSFSGGNTITTNANFSKTLTLTTTNTGPPAGRTQPGTYTFTLTVARGVGCQGTGNETTTGTLIVAGPNAAPVASAVSISGPLQFNQLLTGNYTYTDADGDLQGASTFRWLRNGTTVVGTSQTYTTVAADVGQTMTFEVTPVALTGTSPGAAVTSAGALIGKAPSTTTITCPPSVTYTGSAQTPCSATATGTGGLNASVSVVYANNTNAGTATADATYAGDATHNGSTATQVMFTINKAESITTISCGSGPFVYTGAAIEPCTYMVRGNEAGNPVLVAATAVPSGNYTNNINAGVNTASASFTFTGDTNHNGSSDSKNFSIDKRTLTASITGNPTKVYDGNTTATLTPGNFSISNLVTGQNFTVSKTTGTYNSKDVATANTVSTTLAATDFTPVGGTNPNNYNLPTSASGPGNITLKALTITADNKSFLFGDPLPALTASFDSFVAGEGVGNLMGTLTFTVKNAANVPVTYNGSTPAGTYTIVPGGVTSTNYNICFVSGTLNIGNWTITGFYQPVDMNIGSMFILNTIKGGSTVPLKFNIYAGTPGPLTERKSISDVMFGSVQVAEYACSSTPGYESPMDVTNTGSTSLRYDTTGAQFIQNWQTPKQPNKCYQVRMTALDGSHIDAYFKTK